VENCWNVRERRKKKREFVTINKENLETSKEIEGLSGAEAIAEARPRENSIVPLRGCLLQEKGPDHAVSSVTLRK
jgi:hypothetical protein